MEVSAPPGISRGHLCLQQGLGIIDAASMTLSRQACHPIGGGCRCRTLWRNTAAWDQLRIVHRSPSATASTMTHRAANAAEAWETQAVAARILHRPTRLLIDCVTTSAGGSGFSVQQKPGRMESAAFLCRHVEQNQSLRFLNVLAQQGDGLPCVVAPA